MANFFKSLKLIQFYLLLTFLFHEICCFSTNFHHITVSSPLPPSYLHSYARVMKKNSQAISQSSHQTILSSNSKECDIFIVGGGLCGTTAAFYLNRSGFNIFLAEEKHEIGGCIHSCNANGYIWEEGANSLQPNLQFLQFLSDIKLLDDLILANSSLPRYIYWNGQLHSLPSSLLQLYRSKLFSWRGKVSLLAGLLGIVRRKPKHEESIEEFATRHFGKEVYFRLIEPFVSGVYAGDPRRLSMASALKKVYQLEGQGFTRSLLEGGIVSMLKKKKSNITNLPKVPPGSLASLKDGIQSIPLQIQSLLGPNHIQTSTTVEKITPFGSPGNMKWITRVKELREGKEFSYDVISKAILVTAPAFVTEVLLTSNSEQNTTFKSLSHLSELLKQVYYPPIAGVWAAYPDNAFKVKLDGFGHLIPRRTKIRTLGSIWASTLFPGRAPKGQNILVNFIGGSLDTDISSLSDQQIIDQVDADLRSIVLKPNAPRPHILGIKRWRKSIPQYEKGYDELRQSIHHELSNLPGLYLGGNYISGVAVGDCIQYGSDIARRICQDLKK